MTKKIDKFATTCWIGALVLVAAATAAAAADPAQDASERDAAKKKGTAAQQAEPAPEPPVSPIFAAAARGDAARGDTPTYTNEDLERMWANYSPEDRQRGVYQAERHIGPPEGEESATPGESGEPASAKTPLEELEQERADAAARREQAADAAKHVAELERRVAELERASRAIKNPLLPKSWRQADSGEDAGDEPPTGDNARRLEQNEEQLEQAREELRRAREALAAQRSE